MSNIELPDNYLELLEMKHETKKYIILLFFTEYLIVHTYIQIYFLSTLLVLRDECLQGVN